MAKKPGGKVPESTGELKDPNATPCPKCQAIDALTWYSQELGEQMRGCIKCKYQNTVELWDSLSLKNECEAIAEEMDYPVTRDLKAINDDLLTPAEMADLLENSAFLTSDQANTIAADLYQPILIKLSRIEKAITVLCGSCDLTNNIKNGAYDALRGDTDG